MARNSPIKWSDKDRKALSTAVRVFNTKITRVSRKTPAIAGAQPKRANVQELTAQIKTRADLNNILAYLGRYMVKGAEDVVYVKPGKEGSGKLGTYYTKFEKREVGLMQRRVNAAKRRIANRIAKFPEANVLKVALELEPKKWNINKWPRHRIPDLMEFVRYTLTSYEREYLEKMKQNLLKSIDHVFNGGFSRLERYVRETDPYEIFGKGWEFYLSIEFLYDKNRDLESKIIGIGEWLDRVGAPP